MSTAVDESIRENVIRDAPALLDTLGLVERPMDTKIDSALAILFFGLRER